VQCHTSPELSLARGAPVARSSYFSSRPRSPSAACSLIGHHYYKLDTQIVRATIGQPLDRLRDACHELLTDLKADEQSPP
jgi:hypothetical protein